MKISIDQAIKMANGTIFCDYDNNRRNKVVNEILNNWKENGFIKGFKKIKCLCDCEKENK